MRVGFRRSSSSNFEPPIELRFVDLFMILVTALMFTTVVLSITSAIAGGSGTDDVQVVEPFHILTTAMPTALVGVPYQLMLAAKGGRGDYIWRVKNGTLPHSLSLREDGLIFGTPDLAAHTTFRVIVMDGLEHSATADLDITIENYNKPVSLGTVASSSETITPIVQSGTKQPQQQDGQKGEVKDTSNATPPFQQWYWVLAFGWIAVVFFGFYGIAVGRFHEETWDVATSRSPSLHQIRHWFPRVLWVLAIPAFLGFGGVAYLLSGLVAVYWGLTFILSLSSHRSRR